MLGFYNYTVVLTYVGMLSSFLGLTQAMGGNIHMAVLCLMISGFCDMFDGRIASTRERSPNEKAFGIQIDSLSDLICFGVLPAVIVYQTNPNSPLTLCVCAVYALCALIRLAFFNVDEAERQEQTQEAREIYLGLPVTSAALLVPLAHCGSLLPRFPLPLVLTALLLLMAAAFVSPFRLKKPGRTGKLVLMLIGVAELVLVILSTRGI